MCKPRALLLMILALMLAGCSTLGLGSSDYDCKGYPQGVTCKSARQVYELTNYRDSLETASGKDKDPNCPECQEKKVSAQSAQSPYPQISPAVPSSTEAVQGLGYAGPMPLRSAAKIMRVWIAPWESLDGALHMPTYLYAEVVTRQWSIGEGKMEVAPRVTPLQEVTPPSSPRPSRPPARRPKKKRPQDLSDLGPPRINPNPAPTLNLSPRSKIAPKSSFFDRQTGQVNMNNY